MTERKTILVVEDEPDEVAYLTALFADNDFDVIAAGNGQEGFEKAKARHPDLITLDISMPEESGVRLLRYSRGHHYWRHARFQTLHRDAPAGSPSSRLFRQAARP
jgi:DNA-binding response OmpR family regulator